MMSQLACTVCQPLSHRCLHAHIRPWDRCPYDCRVSSGIGRQKGCSPHSARHVKRDEPAQDSKEGRGCSTSQHPPEPRPARHSRVRAIRLHPCVCLRKRCAHSCEYLLLIRWRTIESEELLLTQSAHGSRMPAGKCRAYVFAPVARLINGHVCILGTARSWMLSYSSWRGQQATR